MKCSRAIKSWWCGALAITLFVAIATALVDTRPASAISSSPKHTVTATPAGAGKYATYLIGPYTLKPGEVITKVAITFPAGCNVSAAAPVAAGDSVNISGQTVTLSLGTPAQPGSSLRFQIGNVRNPMAAGTYSLVNPVVFTRSDGTTASVTLVGKRGQFTILTSPYLMLTIETPDDTQTVDFSGVDPGVAAPSKTVTVTVDSSLGYTISRTVTGDVALMGLSVSAMPTAAQAPGVGVFTSIYDMTPPWTTNPDVQLNASVLYTVSQ